MSQYAKEYSLLPFLICQQWQMQVGYERSVKIQQGEIYANRYLLAIPVDSLGFDRAKEIARRLGMPKIPDETFWDLFPFANLLLIGFDESARGCVYKLYLEFDDHRLVRGDTQSTGHRILHRGIKWPIDFRADPVISDYAWREQIGAEEICHQVASVLRGSPIAESVGAAVDQLTAATKANQLRYLEVLEGDRRSFDLNVYAAQLSVGELLPVCRSIFMDLGLAAEPISRLNSLIADRPLGHLAAGRNRHGVPFVTIYFEPNH